MVSQHAMLAAGKYAEALALRDQERGGNDEIFNRYGVKRWHGTEDLTGKRIMVTHQWGLGDCIMALRYVFLLRALKAEVSVAVPDQLIRTASSMGVQAYGEVVPVEWYDYHVPIMRLLGFFPNIPAPPYILVDKALKKQAKKLVNGKRRVGIAWRGNPKHLRDATRSIDLDEFFEILPGNCQFYSLQKLDHDKAKERGVVAIDYTDFAEVSAVASLMDEIVTVDTAAANLVGAMGLRATVLLDTNHDWRWHRGDEWYPTLTRRVQRVPGDWASCFQETHHADDTAQRRESERLYGPLCPRDDG
jgi:hypothetical protein